jgi:hypothetical protein
MTFKLDRPPYAHNWVRYNYPELEKTTNELVAFALGRPQITYAAGAPIVRDRIALKLDRETALKAAASKGHKKSRPYVIEYVNAFYDYDEVRYFSGRPSYDEYVAPFQISREVRIPVKPLIVIAERGILEPVFSVGWATMPLIRFQRRLLMTVFEDAVFSLTDFQNSKGEFICFPKAKRSNSDARTSEVWRRGDYDLLSKSELKEQVEIYLLALQKAKTIVAERMRTTKEDLHEDPAQVGNVEQGRLDL